MILKSSQHFLRKLLKTSKVCINFILKINFYLCLCESLYMYAPCDVCVCLCVHARACMPLRSPEAGLTGYCEPPDVRPSPSGDLA